MQRARQSRKRHGRNREGFGRSQRRDGERVGRWQEKPVIKGESDNEDMRGLLREESYGSRHAVGPH